MRLQSAHGHHQCPADEIRFAFSLGCTPSSRASPAIHRTLYMRGRDLTIVTGHEHVNRYYKPMLTMLLTGGKTFGRIMQNPLNWYEPCPIPRVLHFWWWIHIGIGIPMPGSIRRSAWGNNALASSAGVWLKLGVSRDAVFKSPWNYCNLYLPMA